MLFTQTGRDQKILSDIEKAEKDLTQLLATQSQHKDKVAKLETKLQKYCDIVKELTGFVNTTEIIRIEKLAQARQAHFKYMRDKAREASEEGGVLSNVNSPESDEAASAEQLEQIEPQEVSRSVDDCHNRLKNIKAKIVDEGHRRGIQSGNEEQIRIKYLNARMELKNATDEISKLEDNLQSFENDIEDRRTVWQAFRKNLVKKTSLAFGNMLGFTNYSGNLHFDHKEGTLQLQVSKNSAEKSQSNDVKALRCVILLLLD
jgi:chromosome segregation ATPase